MGYYIQRGLQQYGPYSDQEVQRYIAQGNIALGDLARTEVMANWVPLSQLIGNTPPPPNQISPVPAAASGYPPGYAGAAPQPARFQPVAFAAPMPPDFHWALVLLLGVVTLGLFSIVWLCVEAGFVKKLKPSSDFIVFLVLGLIPFLGVIFAIIGIFKMRDVIQEYYNTIEPINLRLSGVMTFFFALLYFQYHFSRIAEWKRTGLLQPQG